MSLSNTVSAERLHIGFFGMRNAGKSSLVNAVTGQKLSLVSDIKGTTTDPVKKAMELLPLGPVVIIDTPGLDDEGELGKMRVESAKKVLSICDIAVLTIDAQKGLAETDKEIISSLTKRKIPYVIAYNKADTLPCIPNETENEIYVSALKNINITELKNKIASLLKTAKKEKSLLGGVVSKGDSVLLVIPVDEAAPKGRLILPQQQTIRELLDIGATITVTKDTELKTALSKLKVAPRLVITDSQVFGKVRKVLGEEIPLTSFSIIFARYKGNLTELYKGAEKLGSLKDGDRVLISEGCTHHRQCNDIGTVKLPGWIKEYTGKDIEFFFTSGGDFPEDLSKFALVVHCGACMLTENEMQRRLSVLKENNIPVTNYGTLIAHINGILKPAVLPFPEMKEVF